MKKDNRISPVGLKGNEINERMRALMGIQPINENKSNIVVELTKMGPDGNAYAIIRENHEWYIKRALKSTNLIAEDFKYIGGLMNKKDEAYPSYAKAIKHLNLKFKSLAEAYNFEGEINVFENDNLISEDIAGFSEMRGNGFSGAGNMEENTALWEEEVEMSEAEEAVDRMLEGDKEFAALAKPYDEITYADKIAGAKKNELNEEEAANLNAAIIALITVGGTAATMAILKGREALQKLAQRQDRVGQAADYVLSFMGGASSAGGLGEELTGDQYKLDLNKNGELDGADFRMMGDMNENEDMPTPPSEEEEKAAQVYESRFSIDGAIKNMDRLIENLTEGLKKKV
jgi:hypothetical protein